MSNQKSSSLFAQNQCHSYLHPTLYNGIIRITQGSRLQSSPFHSESLGVQQHHHNVQNNSRRCKPWSPTSRCSATSSLPFLPLSVCLSLGHSQIRFQVQNFIYAILKVCFFCLCFSPWAILRSCFKSRFSSLPF